MRVLIVEDEKILADSLAQLFRVEGYEARVAGSPAAALNLLAAWTPDAIVLDLVLPGAGGRALLATIRARPAWHDIPVVVSTGLPLDDVEDIACLPRVMVLQKAQPFAQMENCLAALLGPDRLPRMSPAQPQPCDPPRSDPT